ncbi:MAG TPA: nucleotidyltransferase domain-containing protein [Thermoanaerobaculia bacterium]|nr:nucleotidyltransferase domain-containing protein [Thermoanaerobaculia bacterium]
MRKLHNTGVAIDVNAHLPGLLDELRQNPAIVAVFLYGSYGTPYQTPLSDVDLAVLFRSDQVPDLHGHIDLINQVTGGLHEDDVSVMILNQAPLSLQFAVVAKGRRLLVNDETALADFLEVLFDRYGDFAVDEARFFTEYDRARREELADGAG